MMEKLAEDLCISTENLLHILRDLIQVRAQDLDKGQVGQGQILVTATVADLDATAQSNGPDLVQKPRLTNAGLSRDEHRARVASYRFLQAAFYPGQLLSATDKDRNSPHQALRTPLTI